MGQKEDCKSFDALQLKGWNRNSIKNEEKRVRVVLRRDGEKKLKEKRVIEFEIALVRMRCFFLHPSLVLYSRIHKGTEA